MTGSLSGGSITVARQAVVSTRVEAAEAGGIELLVRWLCGAVVAVAALDLVGWALGISRFTSLFTDYATMKPNTAIGLGLLAVACLLKRREKTTAGQRLGANMVAAVAVALAAATLFEYASGVSLGIDTLLMQSSTNALDMYVGRMSHGTAIGISSLGAALLLLDAWPMGSLSCTLVSAGLSLSALVGFMFNAGPLFGVPWLKSIAVQTAASLLLLQVATLAARPKREPFRAVEQYASSHGRVRWLLPGVMILPFALALPLLQGMRAGFYDAPFALAMLVVLLTAIQSVIVWQDSRALLRAEASRRQAEAALLESEKLTVVGRLSASIAHEINNPLDAVMNLLYLIRAEDSIDNIREYAAQSEEELLRVVQITAQTLNFYRANRGRTDCDIGESVSAAIDLLRAKIRTGGVAVNLDLEKPMPQVVCKGSEMRQVFINLISNALEATPAGGRLVVRTHASFDWKTRCRGVRVVIADNGTGMSAETRNSIFTPFFTTKPETGNGLGLWVAKDLVEKQDGFIRVWSSMREGRTGTVFCVFLPFPD